jgi:hypothetical protein
MSAFQEIKTAWAADAARRMEAGLPKPQAELCALIQMVRDARGGAFDLEAAEQLVMEQEMANGATAEAASHCARAAVSGKISNWSPRHCYPPGRKRNIERPKPEPSAADIAMSELLTHSLNLSLAGGK